MRKTMASSQKAGAKVQPKADLPTARDEGFGGTFVSHQGNFKF